MEPIARQLLDTIDFVLPMLRRISETDASLKPQPEKWSKKEVLGHLIDSASNNQHKFVRGIQAEGHVEMTGYAQNIWVAVQQYNMENWPDLVLLWESYNRHLAHVIRNVPTDKLDNTISISGSKPFTLRFIMADYVEHLKHHLKQILPDAGLESSFENIY